MLATSTYVHNGLHHVAAGRDQATVGDAELSKVNGQSDRCAERSHALALCLDLRGSIVVRLGVY